MTATSAGLISSVGQKSSMPQSYLGSVYIENCNADFNIIEIIRGNLHMSGTKLNNNQASGGSNGINAIESIITADNVESTQI